MKRQDVSLLGVFIIFFLGTSAMLCLNGNLFSTGGIIGIIIVSGSLIGVVFVIVLGTHV